MTPRRLATVLRELRKKAELTQVELAKKAKIPRGYLAKLETGYAKNPSLKVLKSLARELDVSISELTELLE
jgi:transcriptional regulator with XRE-family HTH domain